MAAIEDTVSLPKLTAQLGISRNQRNDMIRSGYVRPISAPHRGRDTLIPASEAARIRKAVAIAAATGIALLTLLCLFANGYDISPSTP